MTRYQRAKRYAFWRGLVIAAIAYTAYIGALSWSGEITAEGPTTSQR
jgi:hypothetical protein